MRVDCVLRLSTVVPSNVRHFFMAKAFRPLSDMAGNAVSGGEEAWPLLLLRIVIG